MLKFRSFIVLLCSIVVMRTPHAIAAPDDAAPDDAASEQTSTSTATPAARAEAPSITTHLQLKTEQIERLDRLYDTHASNRDRREAKIAQKQDELLLAQSPASFDERRASRLLREIGETQRKIDDDTVSTRAKAFQILSPVQRSQLESLARDNRIRIRFDRYSDLLLTPVDFDQALPQNRTRQQQQQTQQRTAQRDNRRRHRGTTRYDVYGGYAFGRPNYGVVGSYGDGPFGAHVGIGSGGPFFGVGIGGVLVQGR